MKSLNLPELVTYSDPDVVRERRIAFELMSMDAAASSGQRTVAEWHWREAVRMISERTPDQVRRMERSKGLI